MELCRFRMKLVVVRVLANKLAIAKHTTQSPKITEATDRDSGVWTEDEDETTKAGKGVDCGVSGLLGPSQSAETNSSGVFIPDRSKNMRQSAPKANTLPDEGKCNAFSLIPKPTSNNAFTKLSHSCAATR
jgi:hypothetical protein